MLDAVLAGHICLDITPRIIADSAGSSSYLAPGRITEVGEAILSGGGSVSNTGLSLHRLGASVRLVGRVGGDPLGQITLGILGASDSRLIQHVTVASGEPSAYTIVLAPPGMDRTFLTCPGPNRSFGPEDVPAGLLPQTRIFHLGYPPLLERMYAEGGEALAEIMRTARESGATTSLDMSMPDPSRTAGHVDWRAILGRALPWVDIFAPSAEELLFCLQPDRFAALSQVCGNRSMIDLLSPEDLMELADISLGMGARVALIKAGHRGSYLRTGDLEGDLGRGASIDRSTWRNREIWAPAYRVQVVTTTGAGDATVGAFLLAVLRAQDPAQALNSACAAGACACEAADAVSGVRAWEEIQARLEESWARIDPQLDPGLWQQDDELGVWYGPRDSRRAAARPG